MQQIATVLSNVQRESEELVARAGDRVMTWLTLVSSAYNTYDWWQCPASSSPTSAYQHALNVYAAYLFLDFEGALSMAHVTRRNCRH
jgi:hypothetical protein